MNPARFVHNALFIITSLGIIAAITPMRVLAAPGGNQYCSPSASCEVGEFLFDDNYTPITAGASCTITSRNTDGSFLFNSVALTASTEGDGWYSHEFTAPSTEGLYRTQLCCTVSGELLCIDKGFEVKTVGGGASSSDIASAVWSHSDRTLTSLGTLVRDIWLNSTRTLTTLDTDNSPTSTTNITQTSDADLSYLEKTVKENRLLLEELVNQPIIEHFLEDDEIPDLSIKLEETRTTLNQAFANSQYLRSRSGSIESNWNSLTESELSAELFDLERVLGDTSDAKNHDSLFGQINWITYSWDWSETEKIEKQANEIKRVLSSAQLEISARGKSSQAFRDVRSIANNLDAMEILVGDTADTLSEQTLYGELKAVTAMADLLNTREEEVLALLTAWTGLTENERALTIGKLGQQIGQVNQINSLRGFLVYTAPDGLSERELKNKALALGGVVDTNKKLLAIPAGKPLANTWLELGSIIFKTVVTNPSELISQTVPLKYYLPPEVREEHVLKADDGLTTKYDPERDQYYVEGEFTLTPLQTITLSVKTQDIWLITDQEIDSLRVQAETLAEPLRDTSFFAQGVTLTSDINASLDKIISLQAAAVTPEAQIRAFREAQIELHQVNEKISKLEDLLAQVGNTATLVGFVGGAQTLAVWGLIIIMVAGFVFLALYMKLLRGGEGKKAPPKPAHSGPFGADMGRFIRGAITMLVFGAFVSAATGAVVVKTMGSDTEPVEKESARGQIVLGTEDTLQATGGEDVIRIDASTPVTLHAGPSDSSTSLTTITSTVEATRIRESSNWIKIVVDDDQHTRTEGWVKSEYVLNR